MTELERYKGKLARLLKHKDEEPNNTYHDWDKEIQRCKINIADEAMEEKTGWIPVSERLPKLDDDGYTYVMVCMDDDFVATTDYTRDEGFSLWAEAGEVIAWMPLPEPYKPE